MADKIISGLGFHHVALKVPNFEESLKFYTEGLGLTLYAKWGNSEKTIAMLDMGDGGILELFANGDEITEKNSGYLHLALKCDDVDAAYAHAIECGAKPFSAPKVVAVHSAPNDITLQCGFVIAPGGEQLEFFRIISAVPAE